MQWFDLPDEECAVRRCASDGCTRRPTCRLEAGGVGSDYCTECAAEIDAWAHEEWGPREPNPEPPPDVYNEAQDAYARGERVWPKD